jgi:hypothetical protein
LAFGLNPYSPLLTYAVEICSAIARVVLAAYSMLVMGRWIALSFAVRKTLLSRFEWGSSRDENAFASHVGGHPEDQLASFHLKRLLNGATGTRIAME